MGIEELVLELSSQVQRAVKPHLGKMSSRAASGRAVGGDTTFAIDDVAEELVHDFLRKVGNIAYYSEDKGLVLFGEPNYVLIVDPIDGTRPAAAGFESCCVSIAAAPYEENPRMADIICSTVHEIKTDTLFLARKGMGVKAERNGRVQPLLRSPNANLSALFWTAGFRGRPAQALVTVLADLIDMSSVDGGFFELGSVSFSLTRLITGQLDACVDIGKRLIDEVPWLVEEFSRVGKGTILNNNPYDVAAAFLVVREAGGVVTDGYGRPLDDYLLLGSGLEYQFSLVAASNASVHEKILSEIERGIEKLKATATLRSRKDSL
jgi:myo-inositol-1(or 4)-monophosphatase